MKKKGVCCRLLVCEENEKSPRVYTIVPNNSCTWDVSLYLGVFFWKFVPMHRRISHQERGSLVLLFFFLSSEGNFLPLSSPHLLEEGGGETKRGKSGKGKRRVLSLLPRRKKILPLVLPPSPPPPLSHGSSRKDEDGEQGQLQQPHPRPQSHLRLLLSPAGNPPLRRRERERGRKNICTEGV